MNRVKTRETSALVYAYRFVAERYSLYLRTQYDKIAITDIQMCHFDYE